MDLDLFVHVYVSSAVRPFSREELRELLARAREKNGELGISGMLLAHEGNFIQMLEGPRVVVKELAAKIHRDPRHSGVITLLEEPAKERQFPEWQMGFRDLQTAAADLPAGFNSILNTPLSGQEFLSDPSRAQRLLLTFKKNQRSSV